MNAKADRINDALFLYMILTLPSIVSFHWQLPKQTIPHITVEELFDVVSKAKSLKPTFGKKYSVCIEFELYFFLPRK